MLELLGSWIISLISGLGYLGIFILMTLESALIPIPSEVTLPFSGSLAAIGRFNFWLVILIATLGDLSGSLLTYVLGAWGQEAVVRKVIVKYGKYLLVSEHEYDHAESWFRRHGQIVVFVSRLLPVVRTFISLPAGVARMNPLKFILYTLVGSFIWAYFLTSIGVTLGNNWNILAVYFRKFDVVIAAVLFVLAAWYLRRKLRRLKKALT